MSYYVKSPADVVRMREQIIQNEIDFVEQRARTAVDTIMQQAALVGRKRIYLYNNTMGSDLDRWPKAVTRRAIEMLNESGLWQARAVRVRDWHTLFLFNCNYRRDHGSPVWRIILTPLRFE